MLKSYTRVYQVQSVHRIGLPHQPSLIEQHIDDPRIIEYMFHTRRLIEYNLDTPRLIQYSFEESWLVEYRVDDPSLMRALNIHKNCKEL